MSCDPDQAVNDLGQLLKTLGWTWSCPRPGLGWSNKRLGCDRKKKSMLVARVGVKGRRNSWAKGELSVQLYKAEIVASVDWRHDGMWNRSYDNPHAHLAWQVVRDFKGEVDSMTGLTIPFVGSIPIRKYVEATDWLKAQVPEWVDAGQALATQIECIHEDSRRHPDDRSFAV